MPPGRPGGGGRRAGDRPARPCVRGPGRRRLLADRDRQLRRGGPDPRATPRARRGVRRPVGDRGRARHGHVELGHDRRLRAGPGLRQPGVRPDRARRRGPGRARAELVRDRRARARQLVPGRRRARADGRASPRAGSCRAPAVLRGEHDRRAGRDRDPPGRRARRPARRHPARDARRRRRDDRPRGHLDLAGVGAHRHRRGRRGRGPPRQGRRESNPRPPAAAAAGPGGAPGGVRAMGPGAGVRRGGAGVLGRGGAPSPADPHRPPRRPGRPRRRRPPPRRRAAGAGERRLRLAVRTLGGGSNPHLPGRGARAAPDARRMHAHGCGAPERCSRDWERGGTWSARTRSRSVWARPCAPGARGAWAPSSGRASGSPCSSRPRRR